MSIDSYLTRERIDPGWDDADREREMQIRTAREVLANALKQRGVYWACEALAVIARTQAPYPYPICDVSHAVRVLGLPTVLRLIATWAEQERKDAA